MMRAIAALAGALVLVSACKSTPPPEESRAGRNCIDRGGQLRVENEGFGEVGVCEFPDKRQCEQWALLRGDCPRGGIAVANYSTAFERYCAIRGGSVLRGSCALPPAGTYVAKLRDERVATLVLDVEGGAVLTTPFPGRPTQSSTRGGWQRSGRFLTVFSGKEQIVFDYEGRRLVPRQWDRNAWGERGLEEFTRQ